MDTRRKEQRSLQAAEAILRAQGASYVARVRGSHGLFDLVAAWPPQPDDMIGFYRLLQVKSGTANMTKAERAAAAALKVPMNCSKELWRFRNDPRSRGGEPEIEVFPW